MPRHRWATTDPQPPWRVEARPETAPADGSAEPGPVRRRWAAARGASLVFLGLALTLGGGLYLSSTGDGPPAVSIPLSEGPRPAAEAGPQGSPGSAGGPERGPAAGPVLDPAPDLQPPGSGDGPADPREAKVFVHLTGAVASPGVREVPAGSRLFQVLEMAGGPAKDADLGGVNLAAVVVDGGQIHVPRTGEVVSPPPREPPGGAARGAAPSGSVNVNTADAAALEELPRVGPVLADRIITWRTDNGPFASAEDLDAVPGIGPALLEALVPLVVVR